MTLVSGGRLGPYEIVSRIGAGGMGEVYRARDTRLGREVAVKVLPPQFAADPERLARFDREAKTASQLAHPNIVTVHDVGRDGSTWYFVTELVEGSDLRRLLDSGRLEPARAIEIGSQIAAGLAAAHEKGIVHRDLKPENILLTNSGQTKIADFGLAKLVSPLPEEAADSRTPTAAPSMTESGMVMGTLAYMSPEQARGAKVDFRSDQFAFGSILYEMLSGVSPFRRSSPAETLAAVLREEPAPIVFRLPAVAASLAGIVDRCLAKEPRNRYASTSDLAYDLARASGESSGRRGSDRRKAGARLQLALLGGVAVIVAVGTAVLVRRPPTPSPGSASAPAGSKASLRWLAVYPFGNLRSDPETNFLGAALADQVTGSLAYASNVLVRPASAMRKFDAAKSDPIAAAKELHADLVLTGTYLKEGDRLRLNLELVDVKTNSLVWRDSVEVQYQGAFELESLVSERVMTGMKARLSSEERGRIRKAAPSNPAAYDAYLRAVALPLTSETDAAAIQLLRRSIALDPGFGPGYARLASRVRHSSNALYVDQAPLEREAERDALKALELDPELVDALNELAGIYTETGRTEDAAGLARRELLINPNEPGAHMAMAYCFRYAGMLDEAFAELERFHTLDPLSSSYAYQAAVTLLYRGDFAWSLRIAESMRPASAASEAIMVEAFLRLGLRKEAAAAADRCARFGPGPFADDTRVEKLIASGDRAHGLELARKEEQAAGGIVDGEVWYHVGAKFGGLGDAVGAVRCVRRSIDFGFFCAPALVRDPLFESVRADPAFQKLIQEARERSNRFRARFFPGSTGL